MVRARCPGHALALAFIAFVATLSACASDEGPEGTTVSLEFCGAPDWVAIQDGNSPWQRIMPVSGGTFEARFESAKGGIAWATALPGGQSGVAVRYGVPSELAFRCWNGSTAQMNGSVTAIAESEEVAVSLANSHAFLQGNRRLTFSLRSVPGGTWDLFALRTDGYLVNPTPTKAIIRREIAVSQSGDFAALDFEGAEAFTLAGAQVTVTGLGAATDAYAISGFYDRDGWMRDMLGSTLLPEGSANYAVVPLDRLEPGELSALSAGAWDAPGVRLAYTFFRSPVDLTLQMGPGLNRPEITFPNHSPYLRPLARLAAQAEYGGSVRVQYWQEVVGRDAFVEVTSAYLEGTPAIWQLEIPDFTGVDGWDNSWGLDLTASLRWQVEAEGGASPWVLAPLNDGDSFRWAAQGNDETSAAAAREALFPRVAREPFPRSYKTR